MHRKRRITTVESFSEFGPSKVTKMSLAGKMSKSFSLRLISNVRLRGGDMMTVREKTLLRQA